MGLQRRGLNAGETRSGDVGKLVFDIIERPVEAVQDVAILDLARQSVAR